MIPGGDGYSWPTLTRLALWAGVVGPPLFVATFLIEGATRRGYDPVRLQVSYLSLGDQGWMQITNFCLSGGLAIFYAWGLRQALQSGRGSFLGPLLIAAYGLGLIVAGVFVTDAALGYPRVRPAVTRGSSPSTATSMWFRVYRSLSALRFLPASCWPGDSGAIPPPDDGPPTRSPRRCWSWSPRSSSPKPPWASPSGSRSSC